MRSSLVFAAVSLLVQQAVSQADSVDALSHGSYVASKIRRRSNIKMSSGDYMRRRVEARFAEPEPQIMQEVAMPSPSGSSMAAMPKETGPVNLNPMMNDTQAACNHILMGVNPTDDSGMVACYNVNYFDNSTGYFQANMLLYKLAPPSGNWSSLQAGSVHLSMSFPGATVQTQAGLAMKVKRDDATSVPEGSIASMSRTIAPRAGEPMMMEAYTLLGNVITPFNGSLTNSTVMREALTPMITITAESANNKNLSSSLTAPKGAAFVNGYFSDAFIAEKATQANTPKPPFVLPGVTLGFFPIGLIVTSIWTLLFVGVLGFGTFGRIQWRSAYRNKKPNASGK